MTKDQEKAVELFVKSLEMVKASGLDIVCSVDISTGEHDAHARCFGVFEEVNDLPSDVGFGSREIQLLFSGSINSEDKP